MAHTFRSTFEFGLSHELNRRSFVKLSSFYASTLLLTPLLACGSKSESLRFGLLADSHYADRDPVNTRYYRHALEKMKEAVAIMNEENVDFLLHLGDFKDEGPSQDPAETLHFLKTIEKEFSKFEGPIYHCIGNHDVDSITKQQFLDHTQNTGITPNKSYFSVDKKGFHIVVLDANFHKDGRDQFYAEGADWQDPNIPQSQINWLEQDLSSTDLPTLVFCHHPLYKFLRKENSYHVRNYRKIQQIMEKSQKVMAVFQGHVHAEHHELIGGIHYLTQLAMVDHAGLENNSFSIVEIQEGQIRIDGYKRVSDQTY